MDGSAITMMVIGMLVIWGGLSVSIFHAVRKARQKEQ